MLEFSMLLPIPSPYHTISVSFNYLAAFIMATLCNRAGHYICPLWFLLSPIYLLFFPRLISAVADWMSTILPHMVWP